MKIRHETYYIKGAPLTGVNPLPSFRARKNRKIVPTEGFPEDLKEDGEFISKVLPYLVQDRYSRERKTLGLKSFVLENEYLKATFFPEFGGRLHSLFDKISGKELLFANPVIQPGNVANRNAWLSGGIEWNIGNFGHCYTTCDNVFAAVLNDGEGNEFLRIWEFERLKSIFWQVDFHLPDGSPHLFCHVKAVNPFDKDTTTYWWTNIAVPTDTRTRVLASCKKVISFIGGVCHYETLPHLEALPGVDPTYPDNATRSFDYFIQKERDGDSTWECAAYDDGVVFYERSTAPLYYKKLYVWGTHKAGLNWQHSLSDGEGTGYYAELQAGIAPSQMHDKLMPAGTTHSWTQCFGGIALERERLFDENYDAAVDYFDEEINKRITASDIDAFDKKFEALAELVPEAKNILHRGSGFGALEVMRMERDGDGTPPSSMPFPRDTIGEAEKIWFYLLENGSFPDHPASELPKSYMTSEKWIKRIRDAAKNRPSALALMHYGVAIYEYQRLDLTLSNAYDEITDNLQIAEARFAFEKSAEFEPSVTAYRNLAILACRDDETCLAESYYDKALALGEAMDDFALVSEYLAFLAKEHKYEKAWRIYESLPDEYKKVDRIKISAACAAVKLYKFDYLDAFFAEEHYEVREGENSITDVWFEYSAIKLGRDRGIEHPEGKVLDELIDEAWEKCPPAASIDYRQSTDRSNKYRI